MELADSDIDEMTRDLDDVEPEPLGFNGLSGHQKTLIWSCTMADDHQAPGDILSSAVAEAEIDANFRVVCESVYCNEFGTLGRLQHACRSISARLAAEDAINLFS